MIEIDVAIFHYINHSLSSDFLDFLLVPIRYLKLWIPLYLFVLTFVLFNQVKFHWITIFTIIAAVGFADIASSHIIKPLVERPRPCHSNSGLENVNIRVRCGSGYSFTSSHATNHFAIATIFFLLFRRIGKKWLWLLFIWAGLISLAQVYVGVHYPIDITCGSILGTMIATFVYKIHCKILQNLKNRKLIT